MYCRGITAKGTSVSSEQYIGDYNMNLHSCNYHYHLSVSAGIVHTKFCPVLLKISNALQIIRLHRRSWASTLLILHQMKDLKAEYFIAFWHLSDIWRLYCSPPENMLMCKWMPWPIKSECVITDVYRTAGLDEI